MVRMIPPTPRAGANSSEKKIFTALEGLPGYDDWVVIHSLKLARHRHGYTGEADFIVLAPGRGIAIIEAKAPASVRYEHGNWYLEGTPHPDKDPLQQLDGARRSLRGYLRELDLLHGTDPMPRLLWFTSLGRHQLENGSPGDMQFFEWELAWKDDLAKPAWVLEHLFDEHDAWYSQIEGVDHDPAALTAERVEEIMHALLGNFHISEAIADRLVERRISEATLLAEQEVVLELLERNQFIYLDGPAGTGKSHLIVEAAKRSHRAGVPTLVACWNLLMAKELQSQVEQLSNVEVLDFNALMLRIVGLEQNPEDADETWYTRTLPDRACATLEASQAARARWRYASILIDEFQDIAGYSAILRLIDLIGGPAGSTSARLVLAGDSRQQIMRRAAEKVDAFAVAQAWLPGLVHVRVARNCRNVPAITKAAQTMLPGAALGFTGHRMPAGVPGGFAVRDASQGESSALITALKELLQEYPADQVVVLSPFAEHNSLVGRFLARSERSRNERWLRKQLGSAGGEGRVRWRSIFKFKGLDADAVILTDIGETAKAFAAENGLSFADLLYVGLTRAKYRCVVLTGD